VRHCVKFCQDGRTVAEIWRFNGFQDGGRSPFWILDFKRFEIFTVDIEQDGQNASRSQIS